MSIRTPEAESRFLKTLRPGLAPAAQTLPSRARPQPLGFSGCRASQVSGKGKDCDGRCRRRPGGGGVAGARQPDRLPQTLHRPLKVRLDCDKFYKREEGKLRRRPCWGACRVLPGRVEGRVLRGRVTRGGASRGAGRRGACPPHLTCAVSLREGRALEGRGSETAVFTNRGRDPPPAETAAPFTARGARHAAARGRSAVGSASIHG